MLNEIAIKQEEGLTNYVNPPKTPPTGSDLCPDPPVLPGSPGFPGTPLRFTPRRPGNTPASG